jgi:putative membrane-bound dehydrogenase-like protein
MNSSKSIYFFISVFVLFVFACGQQDNPAEQTTTGADTLTEEQKHLPENALKSLTVFKGLEVRAFATEPMLMNPTNIDVDEKGRVWVTEAYNYRPGINGNPTNALGDRIVILEDLNGDGVADTSKVFYQGADLDAPLGICVLGNRVIISKSPYVWSFYDDNNDDKADRKEILFQGIGGEQHDHGVHAFSFGPDGKLYFNFGNEGKTLKDKNGKEVRDQDGDVVGPAKYKQGMVFRCNPDGTEMECLGHNFRNPYEVAVDSYGTLWQSDNDDDGNRGTRMNYVMQYGNYGYKDEMTDASWQANRTNREDSIPLRHWHLNDPGSVPNLLQNFAGSPTGLIVYEGNSLPGEFLGQMIHCDAGPNVVRSYPVSKDGAGYTAKTVNILKSEKDQWFRPADLCVAPDGSLFVADWYDPGVGGHAAGDQVRGRIYRIAASDVKKYQLPKLDFSTPDGLVQALQNPNLSVRYHAWMGLQKTGNEGITALEKLWKTSSNSRMRARALWALVKMPGANPSGYIDQALNEKDPDLRIAGIRAALQTKQDLIPIAAKLLKDGDVQVRRELALAIRHNRSAQAPALWSELALQYNGKDRWYLEALGIGADRQWDGFMKTYLTKVQEPLKNPAAVDIIWRARTDLAIPYLAALASDSTVALKQRLRYFRAFDFNKGPVKSRFLLAMIERNGSNDTAINKLVLHALDIQSVKNSAAARKALKEILTNEYGSDEYLELVSRYEVKDENENLLKLAMEKSDRPAGRNAAGLLLKQGGAPLVWQKINSKDTADGYKMLRAIRGVGTKESIDIIQTVALSNKYDTALRMQAARKIGNSWSGEERVLELLKNKKIPKTLIPDVVASVSGAWRGSIREEAASYLPNKEKTTSGRPAPTLKELSSLKGNAAEGQKIFSNICSVCHVAGSSGFDFGPKLTEIGSKLPKEGLLEAIVDPSAGISFGYEGWTLKLKDGSELAGVITSRTETDIDMSFPGGTKKSLKTSEVRTMQKMKASMMTEGLYKNLSDQDMANLLEFLASLKKR